MCAIAIEGFQVDGIKVAARKRIRKSTTLKHPEWFIERSGYGLEEDDHGTLPM